MSSGHAGRSNGTVVAEAMPGLSSVLPGSTSDLPTATTPTVAIVGGGILGIALAWELLRMGIRSEVFEASAQLGGLAGPLTLPDGVEVDRFYHAILPSDSRLAELCSELGIADQLRFAQTRTGFYVEGVIHSMNNIMEFLRFPPLGLVDRFRLGLTVLAAQAVRNWRTLEGISVEKWLLRWSGEKTWRNVWQPMLRAKFDGSFAEVPATWIWSRLVRVKSTRSGASQTEGAGHLIGGYKTLIEAMARRLWDAGCAIHSGTAVQEVVIEDGPDGHRVVGLRVNGTLQTYDAVAVTAQVPIFRRLIPSAPQEYREFLARTDYLGIICPLVVLDRPLTGFWTLNIADSRFPFTGVIETTSYLDPQFVGGHHLVYLPKYTAPGSPLQGASDEEIKALWMENLRRMLPDFDPASVRYFLVHRERYVEPLHGLNSVHLMPSIETPVDGLFLATTAQIYPALTNGESVVRHAREAALRIGARVPVVSAEDVVRPDVVSCTMAEAGGHG